MVVVVVRVKMMKETMNERRPDWGANVCTEWVVRGAPCRWAHVSRRCDSRQKHRALTISHSNSKGTVVKLDIVDLQHVHEELQHRVSAPYHTS